MLGEFARRREFVRRRIGEMPGVSCPEMAGAFYAFMNIKEHLGKTYGGKRASTSSEWCLMLLEQQNVATVMGSAFGAEGYARLSFAASMETLEEGLKRIEAFIRDAK
jgi:aspartate aminotransferase